MRASDQVPLLREKQTIWSRISSSPTSFFLLSFAGVYLLSIYVLHFVAQRDPGSWFFSPRTAYVPQYSSVRIEEANAYIAAISEFASTRTQTMARQAGKDRLCIGVASVAREGARYMRTAIGSLLAGLKEYERNGIHLKVFIAHTNPEDHPAFWEPWLENVADEVLLYRNISQDQFDHLLEWEQNRGKLEKWVFDYSYMMRACHAAGTEYIVMLEDDVLAMDGWYQRTLAALGQAEAKTSASQWQDFLYLRLFYSEEFLGWQVEDLPEHTFWSALLISTVAACIYGLRVWSPRLKRIFTWPMILSICCVVMPLLIVLFFTTGRVTWNPLQDGVVKMNHGGCCLQGMVYPRDKVEPLVEWYEQHGAGFVDLLTEEYADRNNELRWAMVPSVVQHIGRKSSKGDEFLDESKHDMPLAEKVWNFKYERFDAGVL